MNTCICGRPKCPGRGVRYCIPCRAGAKERKRIDAIRRTREWNAQNPERLKARRRAYYERTAEHQKAKVRAWAKANPDRVRVNYLRQKALRRPRVQKYGLTVDEYQSLLDAQGGGCAICGRTENGKRHNFDVDHDHLTGDVRGLLCNRCNRLLSNALDDTGLLWRAMEYLVIRTPTEVYA